MGFPGVARVNKVTPVSLRHPLLVFNKNSTLNPRELVTGEGGDWWSWPMGVKAEGTPGSWDQGLPSWMEKNARIPGIPTISFQLKFYSQSALRHWDVVEYFLIADSVHARNRSNKKMADIYGRYSPDEPYSGPVQTCLSCSSTWDWWLWLGPQ